MSAAGAPSGGVRLTDHDLKYEPADSKTLGQGNFGTAKLMRHKASGQLLAIKYIERGDKIDDNVKRELINREENFNSRFAAGGALGATVGVMNVLNTGKARTKKPKNGFR